MEGGIIEGRGGFWLDQILLEELGSGAADERGGACFRDRKGKQ